MQETVGTESVELRARDLGVSERFYTEAIGLERVQDEPLGLGAGGRPLVILRQAEAAVPPPPRATGLFHMAIRFRDRAALAGALRRLARNRVPLSGASDHGVSEALYLADPDSNGIELYRDRPRDDWPRDPDGGIGMFTAALDIRSLLEEPSPNGEGPVEPETDMGHVHLKVSDLERSVDFYRERLGLDLKARYGREAAFMAAGDYHHHVGLNTWQSLGGGPPPQGSPGLERYTIALPSRDGPEELSDPDGVTIRVVPAQ
ncbi:MAG TPA: VOC family protein [Thermoleophilaceae bacterium]|nr:VOC family protein [Thermoleophilaceae bacterium]